MIGLDESQLDTFAEKLAKQIAKEMDANEIARAVAPLVARQLQVRFVSREQFAEANGISTKTVDRAIESGRLEHRREGRRVLIPATAIIKPR